MTQPEVGEPIASLQQQSSEKGDEIRDLQLSDPMIGPIMRPIPTDNKPTAAQLRNPSRATHRILQLWDQLIYRYVILCRT